MIKPEHPRIEIDDLAAVIRETMVAQKHDEKPSGPTAAVAAAPSSTPQLKLQPDFQPRSNNRYHISDLLRYHDRVFVDSAYRAVLKRPPDATESARDLKRLRSGEFNKIDMLAALRYSNEGKAKGVEVDGLTAPALIRRLGRLPVIGYFIRWAIAVVRLPNQVRDNREFAGYVLSQNQQIADFINVISARVAECSQDLSRQSNALEALRHELHEIRVRLDVNEHNADARFGDIEDQLGSHVAQIKQQTLSLEALKSDLEHRLSNEKRLLNDRIDFLNEKVNPMDNPRLDTLYAELEDRFRGSREEIKDRFRVYLPYLEHVRDGLVIDLGSGRGEWLELLKEERITARGVEKNPVSVAKSRERDLEIFAEDFLTHLRSLPDGCAGAVTGFHIIEHVSIDALVSLLDEAMRVLRPGGVAIFETPNPENVLVVSNFFYLDPTHHHPLPSELMQFFMESRGFHRVEVLNLHPWESGRVAGEGELAERFNGLFFGPMDYAIVGFKLKE